MRIVAFTILTPFYFLKAGSLVEAHAVAASAGLILIYLAIKMVTKFVGILPLTRAFKLDPREGMYTTLLMSTGLTFGSISALFGLTNPIIDQRQYTILVTAVIAQRNSTDPDCTEMVQPAIKPMEEIEAASSARRESLAPISVQDR
jgi:Kef-type K+ transport system membrane component KefB